MKKNKFWESKARILGLDKVYPGNTLIQGIPKEEQMYYDLNPLYVGGCGTYRLLTGKFWEMRYLVYKPGPGRKHPRIYSLDVHHYFTDILQPRLGWKLISPQRLERIRALLLEKKVSLRSSTHIQYGDDAEDFLPLDYDSWNSLLESIFSGLS